MIVAQTPTTRHNANGPRVGSTEAAETVTKRALGMCEEQRAGSFRTTPVPASTGAVSMTISDIQALVAARMGVTVLDILSDRQTQAACRPRHVAMWLARHTTTYSLPAIGLAFGNRDHTTVMNGVARTDQRMAEDPAFGFFVRSLRNIITSSLEAAA